MEDKQRRLHEQLRRLLLLPGNSQCADCRGEKPSWASINLGVFLCMECAGVHRSLGTHISKVKSCTLDKWELEWVNTMASGGNAAVNAALESRLPPNRRLAPAADAARRRQFIVDKYELRAFQSKVAAITAQPSAPVFSVPVVAAASRQNAPSGEVEVPVADLTSSESDKAKQNDHESTKGARARARVASSPWVKRPSPSATESSPGQAAAGATDMGFDLAFESAVPVPAVPAQLQSERPAAIPAESAAPESGDSLFSGLTLRSDKDEEKGKLDEARAESKLFFSFIAAPPQPQAAAAAAAATPVQEGGKAPRGRPRVGAEFFASLGLADSDSATLEPLSHGGGSGSSSSSSSSAVSARPQQFQPQRPQQQQQQQPPLLQPDSALEDSEARLIRFEFDRQVTSLEAHGVDVTEAVRQQLWSRLLGRLRSPKGAPVSGLKIGLPPPAAADAADARPTPIGALPAPQEVSSGSNSSSFASPVARALDDLDVFRAAGVAETSRPAQAAAGPPNEEASAFSFI